MDNIIVENCAAYDTRPLVVLTTGDSGELLIKVSERARVSTVGLDLAKPFNSMSVQIVRDPSFDWDCDPEDYRRKMEDYHRSAATQQDQGGS